MIPLDSPSSVGGQITAGDHVDVWVLATKGATPVAHEMLQNMTVMNAASGGGNVTLQGYPQAGRRADLRLEQREDLARAAPDARLGDRAAQRQPQQHRGWLSMADTTSHPRNPRRARRPAARRVNARKRFRRSRSSGTSTTSTTGAASSSSRATSWSSRPTAHDDDVEGHGRLRRQAPAGPARRGHERGLPQRLPSGGVRGGRRRRDHAPAVVGSGRVHAPEGDRAAEGARRSRQADRAAHRRSSGRRAAPGRRSSRRTSRSRSPSATRTSSSSTSTSSSATSASRSGSRPSGRCTT